MSIPNSTMSLVCNSKVSDSCPSGESRERLIKVPFDDLTSLIKTCVKVDEETESQYHGMSLAKHGLAYLAILTPNLCVHSTQDFTIKISIAWLRNCLLIRMSTNLDLILWSWRR